MKKLFLMIGAIALLASCTGRGGNTISITGVDSVNIDEFADSVAVSVIDSLDKTFVLEPIDPVDAE